ncbi:ferric reductase NAD binding domain-containing protein [Phellopilus nigrolimitatus]|nr:ferric reductase NAD binding domain-containing protein [Phellopilus nigrolimitatus]
MDSLSLQARGKNPNSVFYNFRITEYPKYAACLTAVFIGTVALYYLAESCVTLLALRRASRNARSTSLPATNAKEVSKKDRDREAVQCSGNSGRVSLRRIPFAILNAARVVAYRITLRDGQGASLPLVEIVIPACYVVALLTFAFTRARDIGTGILDPNYWADRAGTLAVSQLTFIVALAGKNNIISALTGIGYEKLNILHRAASRTVLILIWVHFWGRWKLGLTGSDEISNRWVQAGILGAVAYTLGIILGTKQLRNRTYELFLIGHILLYLIFLLTIYFHVRVFAGIRNYVWPAFTLWGLDRTLRFARVVRNRFLSSRSNPASTSHTPARAKLEILSPDALRVSLRMADVGIALGGLRWSAGQTAYLSIPAVSRIPFEAHPFTIASVDAPLPPSAKSIVEKEEREVKFIIRARRGFTRRLHEYALRAGGVCSTSAYVDGPYGYPPDVNAYPRVVLVAGGSGVSFTLPLLLEVARRVRDDPPSTLTRRVLFVWFIREREHVEWIANDLAALEENMPDQLNVEVRVFVTRKSSREPEEPLAVPSLVLEKKDAFEEPSEKLEGDAPASGSASAEDTKESIDDKTRSKRGIISRGRPSVAAVLEEELELASGDGSACVSVSGPLTLIDDVRAALRGPRVASLNAVLRGGASVFLHVEHFGM